MRLFIESFLWVSVVVTIAMFFIYPLHVEYFNRPTQPAISTVIVNVRGCDIVQLVQDDKLVTAFSAPDQPKSCKVAK